MSHVMEMNSAHASAFYNLTAANLEQAPVLLSDFIELTAKAAEAVCVCRSLHKAWAKSNNHMCSLFFPK